MKVYKLSRWSMVRIRQDLVTWCWSRRRLVVSVMPFPLWFVQFRVQDSSFWFLGAVETIGVDKKSIVTGGGETAQVITASFCPHIIELDNVGSIVESP
jgi:hypothetical protein